MEDISLQSEPEKEKIILLLENLFPELTVFHYSFGSRKPRKMDLDNPLHIFFHTVKKYGTTAFDFELRIYRTSSACETQRTLYIAQKLSDAFGVPALVLHSTFPFHEGASTGLKNVLFRDHKAFIADDSGSAERDYVLPVFLFDAKGDFTGTENK